MTLLKSNCFPVRPQVKIIRDIHLTQYKLTSHIFLSQNRIQGPPCINYLMYLGGYAVPMRNIVTTREDIHCL